MFSVKWLGAREELSGSILHKGGSLKPLECCFNDASFTQPNFYSPIRLKNMREESEEQTKSKST